MRIALLLTTALTLGTGCAKKVLQSTVGMTPTIAKGEKVGIDVYAYTHASPSRWDVVAIQPNPGMAPANTIVLKRVIALPMETISLTSTGIVVNGSILGFPRSLSNVVYHAPEDLSSQKGLISFPYTVPINAFFVVGDNWSNSLDSRYYGAVPGTNIFGQVMGK